MIAKKDKPKISLGFDDEIEEIQSNTDAVLEDVSGQRVEYSRNLMYKIILTPHTQDIKRQRKQHGGNTTVPLFYEEEEVMKEAAAYLGLSLNDFIRDAALDKAKSVLKIAHKKAVELNADKANEQDKFTKIMFNPLNQTKVKLSDDEFQKLSAERKAEREKNK